MYFRAFAQRRRGLAALLVCALLAACATPAPPRPSARPADFDRLVGWRADDHVAALAAWRGACKLDHTPAGEAVCALAARAANADEASARTFFERHFRLERLDGTGLLTAYFTPTYEARARPTTIFSAPVRPRPPDLPASDLPGGAGAPYATRAEIEARPAADAIAWMRPEELFFLQIQGSGVLIFADGARFKAVFDGSNGAPFVGIARPMRARGLLAEADTTGDAIRAWLAAHQGAEAEAIMRLDPRYVFFRLTPDDGAPPTGAAGVALVGGRSLAVDPTWHGFGDLLWLDATDPVLAGAVPAYRRLAVALDIGSAIKGAIRADLYLGEGPAAGLEAGRARHVLRLWRLRPVADVAP